MVITAMKHGADTHQDSDLWLSEKGEVAFGKMAGMMVAVANHSMIRAYG